MGVQQKESLYLRESCRNYNAANGKQQMRLREILLLGLAAKFPYTSIDVQCWSLTYYWGLAAKFPYTSIDVQCWLVSH
jgi:hypothetical protein